MVIGVIQNLNTEKYNLKNQSAQKLNIIYIIMYTRQSVSLLLVIEVNDLAKLLTREISLQSFISDISPFYNIGVTKQNLPIFLLDDVGGHQSLPEWILWICH